jgi:hypothetical protein
MRYRLYDGLKQVGYASPAAAPYMRSPFESVVVGASSALAPFRCSLPAIYRQLPGPVADTISLYNDYAMFGMDYRHVVQGLPSPDTRQAVLFDPAEYSKP